MVTGVQTCALPILVSAAGTVAGTYPLVSYRICEVLNPANCDTTTVTVVVSAAPIIAADDTVANVDGVAGNANVINIFTNDTLNGNPATLATVNLTVSLINPVPPQLTFNPLTGVVGVPAGTPAATYDFQYTICEILNPTNCDDGLVTITVGLSVIVANDDNFSATPVSGLLGGTTATVYSNDTLNGIAFAPAAVNPTLISNGGIVGLTMNPLTGTLVIPPATPAGSYPLVSYRICEVLNPANCDTTTVTVDRKSVV